MAPKKPTPKMIVTVELDEQTHELNLMDLRSGERIALERHAEMPWVQVLREGWLSSELILTYAGYLAVVRDKGELLTFERFLDLADQKKAAVTVRTEGFPGQEDDEPARPTKSRRTSGSRS